MASATYAERIREARPRLSKSFKRLADYILDSYVQAALMTASELAHEVDVDAATVVRFAQSLDYSGFPQLQDEIKARVLEDFLIHPIDSEIPDSIAAQADRSLGDLSEAIERSRRLLDSKALEKLVDQLGQARRILLLADGEALTAAQKLLGELETLSLLATLVQAENSLTARALAAANEEDFLLVLDMQGEAPLTGAALKQAASFGLGTAAVVGGASFESARRAALVLEVPYQEESGMGELVFVAVVEALAAALRWQHAERYAEVAKRQATARRNLSPRK